MFVLLENLGSRNSIFSYDVMGVCETEFEAIHWRQNNSKHRVYKHCSRDIRGRYLLFETDCSDSDVYSWDCIGSTMYESEAINWVHRNCEFRVYKAF